MQRFIKPHSGKNKGLGKRPNLTSLCGVALLFTLSACSILPEGQGAGPYAGAGPSGRPVGPQAQSGADSDARSWQAYREQAAKKIIQSNAGQVFAGPLPTILAAIPSFVIEVNADGSVRDIEVTRTPRFSPETIEMAKAAIRRAAPFASARHLPRPWQFGETFLYNDDLKFQLHTLQPK